MDNEKKLYSINVLSKEVKIGNRQAWKNLIYHENYKHLFEAVQCGKYTKYTTDLSTKELKNTIKEYIYNVRLTTSRKGVEARLKKLDK